MNSREKGKRGEIWRDIPDYEGVYQASNLGRIRRIWRGSFRITTPYINKRNGYSYTCLCENNIKSSKRTHRLIMAAFYGKRDDLQVNHINGDKADNDLSNLQWCSRSENMKHAYACGLEAKQTKQVVRIDDGKVYESLTDAANEISGQISKITLVCQGKRKRHRGYSFAYRRDYEYGKVFER